MQPLKQCVYHRAGLFLAFLMAFFRCFVSNQFLDFVQDPDPCHCVVCNSLFQLLLGEVLFQCRKCGIKTASRVGKAAGHGNGIVQPVVCLVAIAGQVSMETSVKKLYRMISGAGSLIIEERHTRGAAIFIRKIYPHPVLGGTLLIRLADHLYPSLVTVDVPAFQEFLFHPVIQQFQVTVRTADDPVCHGFHALLLDHSSFVFLCVLHPDLRRGRACCFLSAKNPERRWENVMIYLRLFLNFLMIGALSFGGGYGMVSLVRETVLSNGWLTENEFLNFIAVSESTPGPLAVNMATFIGSTQGGILGSFVATLGVVLPSFLIILLIASALKNLMKYAPVNAFLSGVRPCVVAMILATALSMALSTLFGLTDLQAGFAPDLRSIAVFAMLGATHLICKIIRKTAPSPILMILFSAGLGILFW